MLVSPDQNSNFFSALHETWETYFQVNLPSRFHDPALAPVVGRPIDVCYEVTGDGRHASGGACDYSTDNGQTAGVTFDDPRSEFNGAGHFAEPFPGSIHQRIAKRAIQVGVHAGGPAIGTNRDYSAEGVRAPN